jgi:hypothetical protein
MGKAPRPVPARHLYRRRAYHGGIAEEALVEIHGGKEASDEGTGFSKMTTLYQDPWFTFRFADDRLISRFHLEGIEAGRRVSVFKIASTTGESLGLLTAATVGKAVGWE